MLNPASDRSFTSGLLREMVREIMFRWYRMWGGTVAVDKTPQNVQVFLNSSPPRSLCDCHGVPGVREYPNARQIMVRDTGHLNWYAIWFIDKKNQVPDDTKMKWKDWVHVTKLDPDKQLKPGDIDAIAASGTDALMLSGTLNVTKENLASLLKQVKTYDLPLVMEPAGPEAVLMQGIDYVFVPSVINSTDVQWIVGKHRAWVQLQKGKIPWETIVPEAYIVLNPDSSVGRVTKAICDLRPSEVAAYATIADHYFHFPIVYIEYSGIYGDPNVVKSVSDVLDTSFLYYGGGINSAEKAAQMSKFADTIVVGNAVYDQGAAVLKATVDAIQ